MPLVPLVLLANIQQQGARGLLGAGRGDVDLAYEQSGRGPDVVWIAGGGDNGAPWRAAFYTPANNPAHSKDYYSFDFGNAHVVVLDSIIDATAHNHNSLAYSLAMKPSFTALKWSTSMNASTNGLP